MDEATTILRHFKAFTQTLKKKTNKHSIAVAAKVGMLEEHLKFIGKTSDRRKCSRSTLAEANVDKRVAGKNNNNNNTLFHPKYTRNRNL